jgi:agmatinase
LTKISKNQEVFIGCESEYNEAEIVLFGAPFDSTTSYRPGTRFGSRAIRTESGGLETYSPYQDKDLCDRQICDSGDIELPFGDTNATLALIEERAAQILQDDKIPFMVGGEHLVTLGAFRAALAKYPDLRLIHFDAHTDLRDDYLGVSLSHACVIRRCHDLLGDGKIWQFGIRSGDRPEFQWAAAAHTHLHKFDFDGLDEALAEVQGHPVYFTLDLDVLDPAYFPGTGTPEAGGVTFLALLNAVLNVCQNANVVACDVNELAPNYDQSGVSTAVAGKIIREMLLAL